MPNASSARVVVYEMDVTLHAGAHRIKGKQHVTWRNDSDESVSSLWWHLYLNAFENDRTTLHVEGEGRGRGRRADYDKLRSRPDQREYWGHCTLTVMKLADGHDLLPSLEFRQPDDGNDGRFLL